MRLSFSRHQTESTQWDPFSSTSARRNTENRRGKVSFKLHRIRVHLLQLHSAPLIIIIISYFFSFFAIPPAYHSSSSLMVTRTTTQRRRTVESRNCKIVNILHAGGCNLQAPFPLPSPLFNCTAPPSLAGGSQLALCLCCCSVFACLRIPHVILLLLFPWTKGTEKRERRNNILSS